MLKSYPERGPEDPHALTFQGAPSLSAARANIYTVQISRDPFAFPKEAAAGISRAGLCLPLRSRAPKPPSPLVYLGCAGNRPGADSARSPRVSQAQRAATASANRRSLGASRGSPERGGARARKRPGGARRREAPAAGRARGPTGNGGGTGAEAERAHRACACPSAGRGLRARECAWEALRSVEQRAGSPGFRRSAGGVLPFGPLRLQRSARANSCQDKTSSG